MKRRGVQCAVSHPDSVSHLCRAEAVCASDEPEFLYYMNDGVYGSFAYKLLEESIPAPTVHKVREC